LILASDMFQSYSRHVSDRFQLWWSDTRRFFTRAGFSSRGRMGSKLSHSSILYTGPSLYFMLLALGLLRIVKVDCGVPRPQVFSSLSDPRFKIEGKRTTGDPKNPRSLTGWSPVRYGPKADDLVWRKDEKVQRTTGRRHWVKRNDIVRRRHGYNADERRESLAQRQRAKKHDKVQRTNDIVWRRNGWTT